jgi:hypothetical protein
MRASFHSLRAPALLYSPHTARGMPGAARPERHHDSRNIAGALMSHMGNTDHGGGITVALMPLRIFLGRFSYDRP